MNASRNTKIGALAVTGVALVAAGGAFAAGKLHGTKAAAASGLSIGTYVSSGTGRAAHDQGPGRGPNDDFAAAATYLGLTQTELQTALQSGKTLAQVANTTSGKSSSGLIDALVAAEKTELAAAVTAGRLTQAQADQMTANAEGPVHEPRQRRSPGRRPLRPRRPRRRRRACCSRDVSRPHPDRAADGTPVGQDARPGRERDERQVLVRPDRRARRGREDRARSGSDRRQAHPGAGRPDDREPEGPVHELRQRRSPGAPRLRRPRRPRLRRPRLRRAAAGRLGLPAGQRHAHLAAGASRLAGAVGAREPLPLAEPRPKG